ncbi:hypothetical protein [Paraburkholderia sp. SG-MS1]|nr:hypothetical protein [Paraburkholderia sp. SG-MS1]
MKMDDAAPSTATAPMNMSPKPAPSCCVFGTFPGRFKQKLKNFSNWSIA